MSQRLPTTSYGTNVLFTLNPEPRPRAWKLSPGDENPGPGVWYLRDLCDGVAQAGQLGMAHVLPRHSNRAPANIIKPEQQPAMPNKTAINESAIQQSYLCSEIRIEI